MLFIRKQISVKCNFLEVYFIKPFPRNHYFYFLPFTDSDSWGIPQILKISSLSLKSSFSSKKAIYIKVLTSDQLQENINYERIYKSLIHFY